MKKFIATFLLIILVVSAVSTTAFAANTTDTYYTINISTLQRSETPKY